MGGPDGTGRGDGWAPGRVKNARSILGIAGWESSATLGGVGPTRMDYSNNMAAVRAVAGYLSRLLGEDDKERA